MLYVDGAEPRAHLVEGPVMVRQLNTDGEG